MVNTAAFFFLLTSKCFMCMYYIVPQQVTQKYQFNFDSPYGLIGVKPF